MSLEEPLVCDNGTGYIKIGRCTSSFPEYSIQSIVGHPHPNFAEFVDNSLDMSAEFIGEQVNEHHGALQLIRPMSEGIVQDWEHMEKV